jgi:hypothetical protein
MMGEPRVMQEALFYGFSLERHAHARSHRAKANARHRLRRGRVLDVFVGRFIQGPRIDESACDDKKKAQMSR